MCNRMHLFMIVFFLVQVSSVVDQREAERRFFTSLPRRNPIAHQSNINPGGDALHGNAGPSRRSHEGSRPANNLDANGLFRLSFIRREGISNVCYSNSGLCVIFNTGPFREFLKTYENTNSPFLQELIRISRVQPGLFPTVDTTLIRNMMSAYENRLHVDERSREDWSDHTVQRDVLQFIEVFLKCLKYEVRSDSVATAAVDKMFTSQFEYFYQCKRSNNTDQSCSTYPRPSEIYYPSMSLGVDGFTNLVDCYDGRESTIPGFKCSDCKYDMMEKEFTIATKLPKVLLLKLQIYKFDGQGHEKKTGHKMQIPLQLKCKEQDPYVLVGASLHKGDTINSGHYISLIINPNTGKGVLMDDNGRQRDVDSEEEIQSLLKDAYMLAYENEEEYNQRSQGQSPVKKCPKSMDVSTGNHGDHGTPAPTPTDLPSRILTSRVFIDLKKCQRVTAVEFCQELGLDSTGNLAELRQSLDRAISDIIQKSDLSQEEKAALRKRYQVSKQKTKVGGGDGDGAKEGGGQKTGGIFQKAANSVRNLFNRGGNGSSREFGPEEVVKILDNLDSMDRSEVQQYLKDMGTTQDVVKTDTEQLKQCLKGMLVSQLIGHLSEDNIRELLNKSGIVPHKNNDKLAGQIKSKAMEDVNILKTVMAFVLSLANEQQPLDLDITAGLLDQLSKKWSTADMKAVHKQLFDADVPGDFAKNPSRFETKMKKEILSRIVDNLIKDNAFETVYKDMNVAEVKKSRKKSSFIAMLSKANFEKLPDFVELMKKQSTDNATPGSMSSQQQPEDTATSHMEVDKSLDEDVNMDDMNANANIEDESVAGEDAAASAPAGGITLTEARQLVHGAGCVERCSKEELMDLYKRLGGTAKTVRSENYFRNFVKPKALTMVMDNLPFYIWKKVLKDFHISHGARGMKSLLHKSAMEEAKIMDALTSEFDAIHDHNCCLDDFYPSNWLQIQENVLKMAQERKNKLDLLNEDSRCVLSKDNPMLQAAKQMEKELNELKREFCHICEEYRFDSNVDPKTGICAKCTRTKTKDGVWIFSRANNMHPGKVPEQLKNLTSIEQAAIGMLHPQLNIQKYRGGGTALRGHGLLFRQDVGEFYKRLPLRPQDLPFVVLIPRYQTRVPLYANQWRIKYALEWLKDNSHCYKDVDIVEANLAMYPPDSDTPVVGIPSREVDEQSGDQAQADNEDVEDHHGAELTGDMVETAVFQEVPTELSNQRIRNALNPEAGAAINQAEGGNQPVAMPNRLPGFVSEFTVLFLLSMAFPHLFPYGQGDFFDQREVEVKLLDWLDHLLWLKIPGEMEEGGNRFARDKRFIFFVVNLFQRHRAIMLGSVFANNVVGDLTFEQVKEALQDTNNNLVKCMRHMSAQIPGTNAVLSHARKLTKATEEWVRIHSSGQERFSMFLTFSMADNHMDALHRLLPNHEKYLGKTPVDESEVVDITVQIDKKRDWQLRQDNINNNQHIVNYFVHKKMELLRKYILTPYLGMIDYVIRTEFQSRSAVHFHMIARCVTAPRLEDMEIAFRDYFFIEDFRMERERDTEEGESWTEEEIEAKINRFKRSGSVIVPEDQTEIVRAEVERVRKLTVDFAVLNMGNTAMHPELDSERWPPPVGSNLDPPSSNPLRSTLETVLVDDQTVTAHNASMVSRVQLHNCVRGYCKKKQTPQNRREVDLCRFGYPKCPCGYEQKGKRDEDGNIMHGQFDYVRREPITNPVRSTFPVYDDVPDGAVIQDRRLCLLRNHPSVVAYIPELMIANGGNMNSEVIKNVYTLIEYICKYLTKPETSSMQYNAIMADVAKLAENDYREDAVRRMCSRIFLTLIKEHDLGRSEAFLIVSQTPYVDISREVVYLNLTDQRRMNVEQYLAGVPDAPTLSRNHADIYHNRENEKDYERVLEKYREDPKSLPGDPRLINLYKFAELFDKNWHYTGVCRVPVPSPLYSHCPNKVKLPDPFENYCRIMLFLHKPGTNPLNILWRNVYQEDEGQFESLEAAMKEFVEDDSSQCPDHVRKAFLKALQNEEESTNYGNIDDADELIQSPAEPEVVGELLPGLAPPNVDLMEDQMDEAYLEMVLAHEMHVDESFQLEHDQAHNWQEDRLQLGLSDADIDKLRLTWLTEAKESFEEDNGVDGGYDPDNLNPVQRRLYEIAMQAVENPQQQFLIDCCGSAGTGKSYTINTILQQAERGSVKIVAPTGAAASQFHGGQTIHAFFKINVSRQRSQRGQEQSFQPLSEPQAQDLEEALEHVKLIILDEKGMVGLARLYQIHRRLQEGRPDRKNEPFGGMSIMICGDLKQLPPVFDVPLYGELNEKKKTEATSSGQQLYRMFDHHTYILKQQMRQQGDSNAQFRDDLNRLAGCAQFDQEQYTRWKSRMDYQNFNQERKEDFDNNATVLAAIKADLKTFNASGVKKLGQPICRAKAINNPAQAESFKDDQADGLLNEQFFAHGSRVVLTRNLMSQAGLVNGSQGEVRYIVFQEKTDTTGGALPDMLLVRFPNYTGPSYRPDLEEHLVPIFPTLAVWYSRDRRCMTRFQFPLLPGYAITIHKSQGKFNEIQSVIFLF